MFKFRRSSLCSNPEVVSTNSSSDDEPKLSGLGKGSLRNSVSESRLAAFSYNSPDEKESLSSSSLDSVVPSPENIPVEALDPNEPDVAEEAHADADGIFEKCKVREGKKGSAPVTIAAMSDRKRKERHESSSQEQEKKVIRGNDSEPAEVHVTKNGSNDAVVPFSEKSEGQLAEATSAVKSVPPFHAAPQMGYGMRTMPMDFEPEVQRQFERTAAQWNSRKTRRPHRSLPAGKSTRSDEIDGVSQLNQERSRSSGARIDMHRKSQNELKEQMSSERESVSELDSDTGQDQDPFDDENEIPKQPANLAPLPLLDLSTLHENIDSMEPISACRLSSSEHPVLSPRNRTLIRDAIGVPHVPLHQSPVHPPPSRQDEEGAQDSRINGLFKQIGNFKKQIKQLELDFENIHWRKPSQMDRQNNKDMRKCLLQISRAKKELQMIREDSSNQNIDSLAKKLRVAGSFTVRVRSVSDEALKQLQALVGQIQTALDDNRKASGRPEDPILMTQQELVSEKNSMQKQLLVLERRHGRPESKEEKDIVKPLYSRYRLVKKLSFRFSSERENSFDLVPIFEHETLEFSGGGSGSRRPSTEPNKESSEVKSEFTQSKENRPSTSATEVVDLKNEDFNEMSLPELESKHKLASDEKKRLRTILRNFEMEFQNNTGRVPQKEDKYSTSDMELLYQKYKHFRANTKLLDVLITKKKYPFAGSELGKVED